MLWVQNATQEISDKSQWPTILAVCVSLTVVMVSTVGLRGYVRGVMLKTIGKDDWVILFSAICSIIYSGLAIGQTRWGLGLDLGDRPKVNINKYAIINFVGRPFYMAGITGFKVALCISYLRILKQSSKVYKHIVWFVMISCVVLHVAGTLVLIFQCKPVYKSWKPLTVGKCLPNDKTFYSLAGVTILYDCIIFLLPIPILLQLQINNRRKVALIGMFVLGLFTTICSIMRMIQIITIAKTGNSTMLVLWGTIEMNVGISLCCIPTLTPLFTYFREKSTTAKYGYNSNGYPNTPSNNHSHHHNGGHSLNILKSQPRSRITENSSDPWKDRDSSDDSSQKGIMGLESAVAGAGEEREREMERERSRQRGYSKGITATTRVEVKIEDVGAEKAGVESTIRGKRGWGA